MLQPKRTKFRKQMKGRNRGLATRGCNVSFGEFGLKAVGGWTPDTGSFFIYLSINFPLGGPPFLFVTGLAGGFGINTQLNLPTVDKVGTFPLLPASNPPPVPTRWCASCAA